MRANWSKTVSEGAITGESYGVGSIYIYIDKEIVKRARLGFRIAVIDHALHSDIIEKIKEELEKDGYDVVATNKYFSIEW